MLRSGRGDVGVGAPEPGALANLWLIASLSDVTF
jgi:hypothetical protein